MIRERGGKTLPGVEHTEADALASPQPDAAHPEIRCGDCGVANPVWFAPSPLWNLVMGGPDGIVCPLCFIKRAEAKGIKQSAWQLMPEAVALQPSGEIAARDAVVEAAQRLHRVWQRRNDGGRTKHEMFHAEVLLGNAIVALAALTAPEPKL